MDPPKLLQGWLKKQGDDLLKAWKKRYFKQIPAKNENWNSLAKLYYFSDDHSDDPNASQGYIDLTQITSVTTTGNSQFQLQTSGRVYVLSTVPEKGKEQEELNKWTDGIGKWTAFLKSKLQEAEIKEEKEISTKDIQSLTQSKKSVQGWLSKRGESDSSGYKKRFFKQEGTKLNYYKSEADKEPAGTIDLSAVKEVTTVGKDRFDIVTPNRTYHLETVQKGELASWVDGLNDWVKHFRLIRKSQMVPKEEIKKEDSPSNAESQKSNPSATSDEKNRTSKPSQEIGAMWTTKEEKNNEKKGLLSDSDEGNEESKEPEKPIVDLEKIPSEKTEKPKEVVEKNELESLKPLKGILKKQGEDSLKSWKTRYFVQKEDKLFYFKSESVSTGEALGFIDLAEVIDVKAGDPTKFQVITPSRVYYLQVEKAEELDYWVNGINTWLRAFRKFEKVQLAMEDKKSKEPRDEKLEPMKGWLKKQGEDSLKGFKNRYFKQDKEKLFYYKSETITEEFGYIDVSLISEVRVEGSDRFDVVTSQRTFVLQVSHTDDMVYWVDGLKAWMKHYRLERKSQI